jgi:hypothetical protein
MSKFQPHHHPTTSTQPSTQTGFTMKQSRLCRYLSSTKSRCKRRRPASKPECRMSAGVSKIKKTFFVYKVLCSCRGRDVAFLRPAGLRSDGPSALSPKHGSAVQRKEEQSPPPAHERKKIICEWCLNGIQLIIALMLCPEKKWRRLGLAKELATYCWRTSCRC